MSMSVQSFNHAVPATAVRFGKYRDGKDEPGEVLPDYYIKDEEFLSTNQSAIDNHFDVNDFNWNQDVRKNLRDNLDAMAPADLIKLAKHAMPALKKYPADQAKKVLADATLSADEVEELKEAIVVAQLKGINSMANHALTAEQPSVAPLSFGVVKYNRRTEVQKAFVNFLSDERKHTDILEKYIDLLGTEPQVSKSVIRNFKAFKVMARLNPAASIFMALSVEAMGDSYFEFMGKHSPDPLYREICHTISSKDEKRHIETMQKLYNKLYRKSSKWEQWRNKRAMNYMVKDLEKRALYPYMVDACRAFGLDPNDLKNFTNQRLKEPFAEIGFTDF
jgi:rubrerythrin